VILTFTKRLLRRDANVRIRPPGSRDGLERNY
jgi:hypothetical protein